MNAYDSVYLSSDCSLSSADIVIINNVGADNLLHSIRLNGIIVFNFTAILIGLVKYANLFNSHPFSPSLIKNINQVSFIFENKNWMWNSV